MLDRIEGVDVEVLRSADEAVIAGWCEDLTSSDAEARARAAFTLAMLPEHPTRLRILLRGAIKREKDDQACASEVLALGVAERRLSSVESVGLFDKLSGCDSESRKVPPLTVRLAAIVALAWVKRTEISQEMIELLRANTKLAFDAAAQPWNAGDIGGLIELVLPSVDPIDVDEGLAELEALIEAHPCTRGKGWPMEVEWPWDRFITRVCAVERDQRHAPPTLSELAEGQRRALLFGFTRRLNLRHVSRYGYDFTQPSWAWKRRPTWRRYLGLDDPGPLDREIECSCEGETRSYPIWKWFRLLTSGKVDADALGAAIRESLSADEIIELGRDVTHLTYATYYEGDDDPSPGSLLLRDLIDDLGERAGNPDVQAIRFTLDKIGEMEMWEMQDEGWKGGPFESRARKATAGDEPSCGKDD
jgi:hypothetical protein